MNKNQFTRVQFNDIETATKVFQRMCQFYEDVRLEQMVIFKNVQYWQVSYRFAR